MLPNDYELPIAEATILQNQLAGLVRIEPLSKGVKTVAWVDVSSEWHGSLLFASVVVFSYPDLIPLEQAFAEHETRFPYVPGFLSFREIPAILKAFAKLQNAPDIVFVDGQWIAHPRRIGIASHLWVLLDIPTVGVGKSKLYGTYVEPEVPETAHPITDPKTGETLGLAYKSKVRAKAILVSPGHLITAPEALSFVKTMLQGYRLPLTSRAAHDAVNEYRRQWKSW
jgi:deoxyribonuclease V